MNKYFLTLLLTLFLTASHVKSQFTFGLRTGLNQTELRYGDKHSQNSSNKILGFQIGAVTNYTVNHKFSIEPEILFIKSNVLNSEDTQIDALTGEQKKRTYVGNPDKYIQIPIRARYKTANKIILQAGVYFGYEFGGKYEDEITVNGTKHITTYTPKEFLEHHKSRPDDDYKEFDWGLGAGIARQFGNNIQLAIDISRRINTPKQAFLIPCRVGAFSLTATYMFGKTGF